MSRMKCPPIPERDERADARAALDHLTTVSMLLGEVTGLLGCLSNHYTLQARASELCDATRELWSDVNGRLTNRRFCPKCDARLRNDGSCCDACDWTAP